MIMYNKILTYLKKKTTSELTNIDLTQLFIDSGLEYSEFNEILKELQDDEKLLTFESELLTTGLQPTSIVRGVFGDIKSVSLGTGYVLKFNAKLTFKGINYELK
jgi:hypothetical protein